MNPWTLIEPFTPYIIAAGALIVYALIQSCWPKGK